MSIFLVDPYRFVVPAPNFTRVIFDTTYNATGGTSTSTAFATRDTLNTTETSGKNYSVFFQIFTQQNSTNSDSRVQLVESATNRNAQNIEPQDASDRFSHGGLYNYAGGTNKTFTLQTSGENTTTHTFFGYQTSALELDNTDIIASAVANSTTTSATPITALDAPLTAGEDYYVIYYAESLSLGTAYPIVRPDGGLTQTNMLTYRKDTTNWIPFWRVGQKLAATSNAQIVLLSDGTATSIIRNKYITALRADKFANTWFASNTGADVTTTGTAFVDGLTLTFTPDNPSNKHLILASCLLDGGSTTVSSRCKLRNTTDAVDYTPEHFREQANATTENEITAVARVVTFASGGSKTIQWQLASETAGTTTALRDRNILVIDLGTT